MDRFATATLMTVLQDLRQPSSFLLDTFFPSTFEDPSEEIHFDVLSGKRRITPFVHPTKAGKVVDSLGYSAKTFKPAYAKDKRIFKPTAPLKRLAGERIGGDMSPEQRLDALVNQELADQLGMLTMREEVMAAEALRTGKVTVSGEGFETVVVDFGRTAGHTIALLTNDRWSVTHADSNPLEDLETGSGLCQTNAGGLGNIVVLAPDAWKAMRARLIQRGEWEQLFNSLRSSTDSSANAGPLVAQAGGRHVGTIGSFDLWVYDQTYVDDAGNTQNVMPSGTVIMGDANVEGIRAYGAIVDEEAAYKATRYFSKSWIEKDPAVRMLLLQSAPLVVPLRPNATVCFSVL